MLNAYLKPFHQDFGLSWAFEFTGSAGWMDDRNIRNGLLLFGLDYTFNDGLHSFYAEGGFKNWYNSMEGQGQQNGPGSKLNQRPSDDHLGMRELFYRFNGDNTKITAGIQTMKLGDYFLVDERVVGIKYEQNIGNFTLRSSLGSVHKNFARQANFCGVRHIYNQIRGKKYEFLGSYLGESNLFGAVLKWRPGYDNSDEEFSDSEFEEVDEFEEFSDEEESVPLINEAGLIFYEEFGDIFHEYKYYYGLLGSLNLPMEVVLRGQGVFQQIPDDQSFAYFFDATRNYLWDNGSMTTLQAGYFGTVNINGDNLFYPSFSNLFYGEVIRRDVQDIPFVFASLQHHFNWKTKFSLKLQYIKETDSNTNEADLVTTLKMFGHFKLTGIFTIMDSDLLDETLHMARLELRAAI